MNLSEQLVEAGAKNMHCTFCGKLLEFVEIEGWQKRLETRSKKEEGRIVEHTARAVCCNHEHFFNGVLAEAI